MAKESKKPASVTVTLATGTKVTASQAVIDKVKARSAAAAKSAK
jgi:hypothetical protein